MDSYAAALAADVYRPGRVAVSIGTSSSYLGLSPRPVHDPRLLGPVLDVFGPGTVAQQGGQTSAAVTAEWFSRELAPAVPLAVLDDEAAAIAPGADGLWAIDTWQGCRTPYRNPAARGIWGGLTLAHTRAHLFRATLESVAFGGRAVLETLAQAGVDNRELVVTGGATRSSLWMQIHADVLGRPLLRLPATQPVTLGAAMCAAVGAGAYPDLPAAAAVMTSTSPGWLPDPDRHTAYEGLYANYLYRLAAVSSLDGGVNLGPPDQGAVACRAGQDG